MTENEVQKLELDSDLYEALEAIAGIGQMRLQKPFIALARKRAAAGGMSLAGMFKKALQLGVGLKPGTWDKLSLLADIYGTSESGIIDQMVEGEIEHLEEQGLIEKSE